MRKKVFLFAAMGCLGMTTEIFFTALTDLYEMIRSGSIEHWRLEGKSYIWMFPIYGLAGILFPPIIARIEHWNPLLRMCVYATGILMVEFATGWFLDVTTGSCPWEYKTGWHIFGYIRLDFFLFWALFGMMVELALRLLSRFDP